MCHYAWLCLMSWDKVSHWTKSSLIQLGTLASEPQGLSCLCILSPGFIGRHRHVKWFVFVLVVLNIGTGNPNSGPYGCEQGLCWLGHLPAPPYPLHPSITSLFWPSSFFTLAVLLRYRTKLSKLTYCWTSSPRIKVYLLWSCFCLMGSF